jgi:hypothetical protein
MSTGITGRHAGSSMCYEDKRVQVYRVMGEVRGVGPRIYRTPRKRPTSAPEYPKPFTAT